MKSVIVNAFGCVESGAAVIALSIIDATPRDVKVTVLAPRNAVWTEKARMRPDIRWWLIGGSGVIRRASRVLAELALWLLRRQLSGVYVNLSNYGLGLKFSDTLYFHNLNLLERQEKRVGGGYRHWLTDMLLMDAVRSSGQVVVQTEATCTVLREWLSRNIQTYVDYGKIRVVVPRWRENARLFARKSGGLTRLVYPASRFRHKRVELAIAGVRAYNGRASQSPVSLSITISGEKEEGIEYVGRLTGEALDVLYGNVDALLFTSECESLGLPLLEALGFGLPAVLPNLPYAKTIYGDAAVYFDEHSPGAVAAAIAELYLNYSDFCSRSMRQRERMYARTGTWEDHWSVFLDRRVSYHVI